jgi:DNA-binding transcriptional MocR family regulator
MLARTRTTPRTPRPKSPAGRAPGDPARPRKSQHLVDALGSRIVSGALAPGDLLPTEAELGAQLGISRRRCAGMRALATRELVEGRTRRGKQGDAAHLLGPARRRRAALAVDRPADPRSSWISSTCG